MLFLRKSKYEAPLAIVFTALLIGGVLFYLRGGDINFLFDAGNKKQENQEETQEEQIIPEGWQTHANTTLRVEFSYPPEWGPIEQKSEPCYFEEEGGFSHIYNEQPCRHVFLLASGLENNPLILSSQSELFAQFGQKRDQYFGDLVTVARRQDIETREFISVYCLEEAASKRGESCETETYPNGVVITKSVQGPIIENEENKAKTIVYYIIYRPNSPYDNIIFSTEFLPEDMPFTEQEEVMDTIVSTLKIK
ncbi:MAG: hypothetical protein R3346_03810 [Candidatus Spechtbacterales bacterium]|nr:hypothetical protein [Candidatus Spechtbacterales bacterium]